jgi:hypothetical protein
MHVPSQKQPLQGDRKPDLQGSCAGCFGLARSWRLPYPAPETIGLHPDVSVNHAMAKGRKQAVKPESGTFSRSGDVAEKQLFEWFK